MSIREIFKKNKLIFNIWNKLYYQRKLKKIEKSKTNSKYTFIDRRKNYEDICIILAGYKEFLWNDVFERLINYMPNNIEVCIVSPGMYNEKLVNICSQNNWSYLSVKENKVTVAQNIAIMLHPEAKYIYKLDEDMFITNNYFENLKLTLKKVNEEKKYKPGIITPLININGYCYRRILEKEGLLQEFIDKFGDAYYDATPGEKIIENGEIAKFLWRNEKLRDIDKLSEKFSKQEFKYSICPIRFSIGAILMLRETWENMGKFEVTRGKDLGLDEVQLCQYCMVHNRPIIVSENSIVGHFSYGPQTNAMKRFYEDNKEIFCYKKNGEENS